MKVRTWGYLLGEAAEGIRKNGVMSVASVSTVALSLFILSVFGTLAFNVQHMSRDVESRFQVIGYLGETFEREESRPLIQKVQAIPGVAEVRFVTKEQALERLRRQFGQNADLLEAVEEHNPLLDSVEVRVPDAARVDQVASQLRALPLVEKVNYSPETVRKFRGLTGALRALGLILAGLLAFATLFIISNTIRISVFARRREIAIMKLVGATDGFIRWPFLLEGAILGLIGAFIATLSIWFGYSWVSDQVSATLPFIPLVPRQPFLADAARFLLITGALLGAGGSILSVRKHLKV